MTLSGLLRRLRVMRGHRIGDYFLACEAEVHQIPEERHLRRLLADFAVDCVFDVGANHGQYATMLRKAAEYKGTIISFEPSPNASSVLRERSRGDSKWHVEPVALSDHDGTQSFNEMFGSEFSSLSTPRHDEVSYFKEYNRIVNTLDVKTETLPTAFSRLQKQFGFQRPFLKLDTQGHDVEIVKHGTSVLPLFVGLQSELAIRKVYTGSVDFREALRIYEECGFRLSAFVPNNSGNFPFLVETDCIMVRDDKSLL